MQTKSIHPLGQLDTAGRILLLVVLGVTSWILLLPVSRVVQRLTLDRYHLLTPSYAGWMTQQVIPAIYTFENRYWVLAGEDPPRHQVRVERADEAGYVNHFPGRLLSFGGHRYRLLAPRQPTCLVLTSCYRGHKVTTVSRVLPVSGAGHVLRRSEVSGDQP
jgi:hypothetical protein